MPEGFSGECPGGVWEDWAFSVPRKSVPRTWVGLAPETISARALESLGFAPRFHPLGGEDGGVWMVGPEPQGTGASKASSADWAFWACQIPIAASASMNPIARIFTARPSLKDMQDDSEISCKVGGSAPCVQPTGFAPAGFARVEPFTEKRIHHPRDTEDTEKTPRWKRKIENVGRNG